MYYNGNEDISVLDVIFDSGKARGLSAIMVRNGTFACTVVKDHALDIAHASYEGIGVAFLSRNGLSYQKNTFAKSFEGGLLYTCGLDNISNCVESVYTHGTLHGTPAENVHVKVENATVYIFGDVPVTGLFCDGLTLHREIAITKDGVTVTDHIENIRGVDADYCLLYHCNFGAPFLAPDGEVRIDYLTREGLTSLAKANEATASKITAPISGAEEVVYYHTVNEGKAEYINADLGIGVRILYDSQRLPVLLEWKSMAEDDYALGLEPSTTRFDRFQKTPIGGHKTHTYTLQIKFEKDRRKQK